MSDRNEMMTPGGYEQLQRELAEGEEVLRRCVLSDRYCAKCGRWTRQAGPVTIHRDGSGEHDCHGQAFRFGDGVTDAELQKCFRAR